MKNNFNLDIKLSEDLLRKFLYICEKENRNPNAQFAFMVRNNIAYYEKTKGRIPSSDLAKIDISEYKEEN